MIKSEIRTLMKEKRKSMTNQEVSRFSILAAQRFISSEIYKTANTVMLYFPLGNETDTSYILENIFKDGKRAVLPVSDIKTGKIVPSIIKKDTEMAEGAYGIKEPKNIISVNPEEIDTVIVPGIAFDKNGVRVGFGKGYYDRFLSGIKAKKAGFCYHYQVTDKITADSFDINMDYIITDEELIVCE